MMLVFHVYYWPILTAIWFLLTFVIAYLISVLNGHVYPFFPYISDTGTTVPESCFFGQLLNFGALLMAVTMYVRYRQVDLAIRSQHVELNDKWNIVGKWFGFVACVGMSVVANFQMKAIPVMHFFGAIMAFGIGSLYFIIQSVVTNEFRSRKIKNELYSVRDATYYARVVMSTLFLPLFFTNTACSSVSMSQFDGETIIWWTSAHKAYDLHLVATFTEWILALLMLVFVLTYINEFKLVEFVEIKFKNKHKILLKGYFHLKILKKSAENFDVFWPRRNHEEDLLYFHQVVTTPSIPYLESTPSLHKTAKTSV